MARLLDGRPVAATVREEAIYLLRALAAEDVTPRLATVLMSDDPADETFMRLKRTTLPEWGVETVAVDIDPSAPAEELYAAVDRVSTDPTIHGVFVQVPLPAHVDEHVVRETIAPEKDVDGFHPTNVGRLAVGDPRFVPVTPLAVTALLDAYDVSTDGADVVIVGRSTVIGRPLANLLVRKDPGGNATVTVCHSRTRDLAAKTRSADVLVTAAGTPELVDETMVADGATVVDVSANRIEGPSGSTVVGDVAFDAVKDVAGAITPVPGGVGPVTMAMLFRNVVEATRRQTDLSAEA